MAAAPKRMFRGVVRGNLKTGVRVTDAVLAYHEKHPEKVFFSDQDIININNVNALFKRALAKTQ